MSEPTEIHFTIEKSESGRTWTVVAVADGIRREGFGSFLFDLIASNLERFVPGYEAHTEFSRYVEILQGQREAVTQEINGDLLRELRHLVRLLETLEWSARDKWGNDQCPTCDGARHYAHLDGCELAARLNGARAAIEKAAGGGATE